MRFTDTTADVRPTDTDLHVETIHLTPYSVRRGVTINERMFGPAMRVKAARLADEEAYHLLYEIVVQGQPIQETHKTKVNYNSTTKLEKGDLVKVPYADCRAAVRRCVSPWVWFLIGWLLPKSAADTYVTSAEEQCVSVRRCSADVTVVFPRVFEVHGWRPLDGPRAAVAALHDVGRD